MDKECFILMSDRVKKFVSYYKPYRLLFAADIFCAVVTAVVALIIPLGIRRITGELLQSGAPNAYASILQTGLALVGLILLWVACTYFYDCKGHGMGAMMERDMRRDLFEHLQRMSFRFYDEQRVGQLMSRITNDLINMAELYHHGPEDLAIYLVKFIGAFTILFKIDAKLSWILLACLPMMLAYTLFFMKKLNRAYKENRERIGNINAQVEENLSGIRAVQVFTNEPFEIEKFGRANESFMRSRKSIYHNESVLWTGIESMTQLITVAVAAFGGVMLLKGGTLTLPDLLAFLLYVGYLTDPIIALTRVVNQYQEGFTGFNRFWEILTTRSDIQNIENPVTPGRFSGLVTFENVSFRYYEERDYVLDNINLRFEPGETVALVGESGVGKTTLCALIPRFYDTSAGAVRIDGLDVKTLDLRALRAQIGIVQQDVYLFSGTVYENIEYGKPGATRAEVVAAAELAGAHEFILALPNGYETPIGERGVRLSGGEKQRLSIARTFLKNPSILIFDEATSALDEQNERLVRSALQAFSENRTTFIITHRMSTIPKHARILRVTEKGVSEFEK
jgi:ATP-binding cassette subfamily B protein